MDLGLHIDTKHVGWSLTDENNQIVRIKGQDMIGVDRFMEAEKAEDRRLARGARRRRKRDKELKKFVNDVFREAIEAIDPLFFERVSKSGLFPEDGGFENGLFLNKVEAIAFREKYPTIYHLRDAVMNGKETDIRYIYIAILHCFKHRGHMLLKGVNPKQVMDYDFSYNRFRKALAANCGINLTKEDKALIKEMLLSTQAPAIKVKKLTEQSSIGKNPVFKVIFTLLFGGKGQLATVFPELVFMQEQSDLVKPADATVMVFDADDFELILEPYYSYLSESQIKLILYAKGLYDWSKLTLVLNGADTISRAMIQRFDKHKEDLAELKDIFRYMEKHGFEGCYKDMFVNKNGNSNNYACYVGNVVDDKRLSKFALHRSTASFLEDLSDILVSMRDSLPETDVCYDKISCCLADIDADNFLPKQKDSRNAVIPNILIAEELKDMLEQASCLYPFLNQIGKSGKYSVKEELCMLHSFAIPYWIGPLNDSTKYAWAVHKETGTVYPWNMEEKIDYSATRTNFIQRMTNECVLLAGETVLCEESYFNRKMQVLDELNGIRINGKKLPVLVKQEIFETLSMRYQTVSQSAVMKILYDKNIIHPGEEPDISGFTKKKLNRTMGCNITARAICAGFDDSVYEMIAEYVAIFKGDTEAIIDALREKQYDADVLKKLLSVIKDSGWGLYSKRALTEVLANVPGFEDPMSLLDALYYTDARINDLLGSDYSFMDAFAAENERVHSHISVKNIIDNTTTTPMVKRSLSQMVNVLKELKAFTKTAPDCVYLNIYVPCNMNTVKESIPRLLHKVFSADTKDKAKKEENRQLLELLNSIKTPLSKRQQLYFLQRGRCLYTGEKIPYESIFQSDAEYNIDHIYPKSKVYDSCVTSNLCLVSRNANKKKNNQYPIPDDIRTKMMPFWEELLSEGLMTQKKFDALSSSYGIPIDVELASIDKLVVEHRKTALIAGTLIRMVFPDTKVVYVSNQVLSDFISVHGLQEYNVINYFPDARKSYYTQIAGKVWHSIFTEHPKSYILQNKNYSLNVWNYDSLFWDTKTSPDQIRENAHKAHTKETYMTIGGDTGALSDSTILSAAYARSKDRDGILPVSNKKSDVTKYGGRTSIKAAFYAIIRLDGKLTLVPVPVYKAMLMKTKDDINEYLYTLGENVEVIIPRIARYSILNINGMRLSVRTLSGNQISMSCARTFIEKDEGYIQNVFAYNRLNNKNDYFAEKFGITNENNQKQYQTFLDNYRVHYENRPNHQIASLQMSFGSFCALSIEQQCVVLEELYGLVRIDSISANLSSLSYTIKGANGIIKNKKMASISGTIHVNNELDKCQSIVLENISHTGLFRNKIVIK